MLQNIKNEFREGRTLLLFGFLKALSSITPLVIARFFSEEMFGTYSQAKLVVYFFITLLISASGVPFVVYASRERAETGKINKSFSIQSAFFVFGIVLYVVLAILFNRTIRDFAEITGPDLIYVSIGFLGIALSSFIINLFLAMGSRIKSSLAEFVFGAINLGIVVFLCFTDKLNIRSVFGAYFISAVAVTAIFLRGIDWGQLLPFRFDFGRLAGMFNFTRWVVVGAMATYFIDWGDNVILKIFNVPMADIGQYSLAYQIFNGAVMLIYILNSYFLPFISENINDTGKIRDYLFRKRPRLILFGLILLAEAFLACPYFFKIVYPGAYRESVMLLRILLIGCAFVLYNTFYIPLVNALQLYRFSQTTNVLVMLIKVILGAVLVYKYGLYGAAAGTIISYFCSAVIYESYYRIKMKKLLGIKTA
jgi:O-antigen/teichoic acid export membrane protein